MSATGDAPSSLAFLRWARPGGPWVLTAIPPTEQRTTETATFTADQERELLAWVGARIGRVNLYWMVNPARRPLRVKASKEDVEALSFLHVDVDPPKGSDIVAAREAILARLRAFTPEPTAIVDSGGGYQAFWRLDEPLYVGGDLGRTEDAEPYNQQLSLLLGGDNCHNCDRIMRLPGTINLPDARKRAAGRAERTATVVSSGGPVHPLHAFTAAPKQQSAGPARGGATRVNISGNLTPVLIDDLPERVSLRTRMLIVQGEDPDDPQRYKSRSEAVFAVCCEMVRAGCDDDTIASVLLDPDYHISASVREQRRPQEYAARQIQRARETAIDPALARLNARHAVIADIGGKCRVISEVEDSSFDPPRVRISKQTFDDFRNRYLNERVKVGTKEDGEPKFAPSGEWWLRHPDRRQYDTLVFAPGREVPGSYNLWQGFSCEALPGDAHRPFLDHLLQNVCSGRQDHYDYLLGWMARAVQSPALPGEVALVLRGGKGTGKSTAATEFGALWGRHFLHISSARHLVGQFNAHLRDCVVLFADEAFFAGDKQHSSALKTLITERTIQVEGKGVDAETAPNCVHLMMASNDSWVVPAGGDERRYFVLDVGEEAKQDSAYFGRLRAAMRAGGREALLHHLMNLDLSGFDVRNVPQTEALREQKLLTLGLEEQWWLERLMDATPTAQSNDWTPTILKEQLQADYLKYAEQQKAYRRVSPTALGRFLNRLMPGEYPISKQMVTDYEERDKDGLLQRGHGRRYFYELPTLEECRAVWDRRYGAFEWPREVASPANATPVMINADPY